MMQRLQGITAKRIRERSPWIISPFRYYREPPMHENKRDFIKDYETEQI